MKSRTEEIVKLWVEWNKKNITGDIFANRVGNILKTETNTAWQHDVRKNNIIREMVSSHPEQGG